MKIAAMQGLSAILHKTTDVPYVTWGNGVQLHRRYTGQVTPGIRTMRVVEWGVSCMY